MTSKRLHLRSASRDKPEEGKHFMPPYVPYIGLSRSQSLRLGRGPGNSVAAELNMGDIPTNPQTGGLATLFYADLGQALVRRDVQHHTALGAIDSVGSASNTVYSDLFRVDGLALTPSASNMTVAVAAGNISSRFYGTRLGVPAQTVTLATAPAAGGQVNYVYVNPAGVVGVYAGATDAVAPTYEAWSVTATGATAGNFTMQFQYNGFTFTTGNIAYNAAGSAVATAIAAATGGPNNIPFAAATGFAPAAAVVGGGTALPGGPATVTFSGALEGPVVPLFVDSSGLTGGTAVVTRTAMGVGAVTPFPSGNALVLSGYYVAAGVTNAAAATAVASGAVLTS